MPDQYFNYLRDYFRDNLEGRMLAEKHGIINERCECGHLITEHSKQRFFTKFGIISLYDGSTFGNGSCAKCDCQQYTFVDFVYRIDEIDNR
jgi:hypothetical protein